VFFVRRLLTEKGAVSIVRESRQSRQDKTGDTKMTRAEKKENNIRTTIRKRFIARKARSLRALLGKVSAFDVACVLWENSPKF
jgi:hypothetical protein